jgi:hypothetical protein
MTERIRQLAEQAGYKDLPTVRLAFHSFDKEKFAQLIVAECAHIGFNVAYPGKAVDVKLAIKQHFGVEL